MYKAAIFDDEYIVLEGLRQIVDWDGLGLELVGTADDGLSALELFRREEPEIILTDIRMPGMDGLQLIEEITKLRPETYCIVFSGFNEFEYVKRAIQLGVVDYIEKPISVQNIEQALRKVLGRIASDQEKVSLRSIVDESKRGKLEKAAVYFLYNGKEALPRLIEEICREWEEIAFMTILAGDIIPEDQEECFSIPIHLGEDHFVVVFHYQAPTNAFWERMEDLAGSASVGAGKTYPITSEAENSYKEAKKALRSAQLLNILGLLRFEDIEDLIVTPVGLHEREEAVILSIRTGNKDNMMEQIDRFIEWIQQERWDPEVAEGEMLKFIYLALQVTKEHETNSKAHSFKKDYLPHIEIRKASTQGKLLIWFREQIEKIAMISAESRESSKHGSIKKAKLYIECHISKDLTLNEVADHVGMNAAYLSVLFKEEMGESYIKYLTRCRIELAKTLLLKGLKVNEVSEKVGYYTYRHFSDIFKKYTGVTPGQYKEENGNCRVTDV